MAAIMLAAGLNAPAGAISRSGSGLAHVQLWACAKAANCVAAGDVDATWPGSELVMAGEDDTVWVVHGDRFGRAAEPVFQDDWFIVCIAVGDVLPQYPGDEIVCAGRSCRATLIWNEDGSWMSRTIGTDYDWIDSIALADLVPSRPGMEVVCSGESLRVLGMWPDSSGEWVQEVMYKDRDAVTLVAAGDVDDSIAGPEVYAAGGTYDVARISGSPGNWSAKKLWTDRQFPTSMVVGDLVPSRPGLELGLAGHSRRLEALYPSGGNWTNTTIWDGGQPLAAVVAGLSDGSDSAMVLGATNGNIIGLCWDGSAWAAAGVWGVADPIRGSALGEIDAMHPGPEALFARSSGRATGALFEETGAALSSFGTSFVIQPGVPTPVPIGVVGTGAFSDTVYLTVSGVPAGGTAELDRTSTTPGSAAILTVTAAPGASGTITVSSTQAGASAAITLDPSASTTPAASPAVVRTVPDRYAAVNTSGWFGTQPVWWRTPDQGISASPASAAPAGGLASFSVHVGPDASVGRHTILFEQPGSGRPPVPVTVFVYDEDDIAFELATALVNESVYEGERFEATVALVRPPPDAIAVEVWCVPGQNVVNASLSDGVLGPPDATLLSGRIADKATGNATLTVYARVAGVLKSWDVAVPISVHSPPVLKVTPIRLELAAEDTAFVMAVVDGARDMDVDFSIQAPPEILAGIEPRDMIVYNETLFKLTAAKNAPAGEYWVNITATVGDYDMMRRVQVDILAPQTKDGQGGVNPTLLGATLGCAVLLAAAWFVWGRPKKTRTVVREAKAKTDERAAEPQTAKPARKRKAPSAGRTRKRARGGKKVDGENT